MALALARDDLNLASNTTADVWMDGNANATSPNASTTRPHAVVHSIDATEQSRLQGEMTASSDLDVVDLDDENAVESSEEVTLSCMSPQPLAAARELSLHLPETRASLDTLERGSDDSKALLMQAFMIRCMQDGSCPEKYFDDALIQAIVQLAASKDLAISRRMGDPAIVVLRFIAKDIRLYTHLFHRKLFESIEHRLQGSDVQASRDAARLLLVLTRMDSTTCDALVTYAKCMARACVLLLVRGDYEASRLLCWSLAAVKQNLEDLTALVANEELLAALVQLLHSQVAPKDVVMAATAALRNLTQLSDQARDVTAAFLRVYRLQFPSLKSSRHEATSAAPKSEKPGARVPSSETHPVDARSTRSMPSRRMRAITKPAPIDPRSLLQSSSSQFSGGAGEDEQQKENAPRSAFPISFFHAPSPSRQTFFPFPTTDKPEPPATIAAPRSAMLQRNMSAFEYPTVSSPEPTSPPATRSPGVDVMHLLGRPAHGGRQRASSMSVQALRGMAHAMARQESISDEDQDEDQDEAETTFYPAPEWGGDRATPEQYQGTRRTYSPDWHERQVPQQQSQAPEQPQLHCLVRTKPPASSRLRSTSMSSDPHPPVTHPATTIRESPTFSVPASPQAYILQPREMEASGRLRPGVSFDEAYQRQSQPTTTHNHPLRDGTRLRRQLPVPGRHRAYSQGTALTYPLERASTVQ